MVVSYAMWLMTHTDSYKRFLAEGLFLWLSSCSSVSCALGRLTLGTGVVFCIQFFFQELVSTL